jgi:hypothetical protein
VGVILFDLRSNAVRSRASAIKGLSHVEAARFETLPNQARKTTTTKKNTICQRFRLLNGCIVATATPVTQFKIQNTKYKNNKISKNQFSFDIFEATGKVRFYQIFKTLKHL